MIIKVNGEKVVDLDPVLGYLHRGVEKLCENADYHQAICYTDPLEYVSSLFCEAAPVAAFEKLMDVDVPRRAQYIRVLTMELNRIASHTLFQGWMALDLGGITPILWAFIERDEIVDMLAALTGQKLLYNYYRIGGVNGDLNHEFMSRLGTWMSRAAAQIDSNLALINENEIFVRRTRGLGVLDAKTALKMGVTGPNLRASGVPFDLRRDRPYLVYPELEFDVPTRDEGDSLARYLVRMDEIKQSIRIIDQVLHEMPDGPVMAKLPRLLRPRPGRAFGAVEGPRGVYGTYAISDGTDQPFRMRIHDPSFVHLQLVGAESTSERRIDGLEPSHTSRSRPRRAAPSARDRRRTNNRSSRYVWWRCRRNHRRKFADRALPRCLGRYLPYFSSRRVPLDLHGDEDHCAHEPAHRARSHWPSRRGDERGARPQGADEGG
ncbi:MAG: hypothetical protein EBR48_06215, partial [bacterium]|nr:hypothetical protein [Candidatus Aquidulcis frankliniae]